MKELLQNLIDRQREGHKTELNPGVSVITAQELEEVPSNPVALKVAQKIVDDLNNHLMPGATTSEHESSLETVKRTPLSLEETPEGQDQLLFGKQIGKAMVDFFGVEKVVVLDSKKITKDRETARAAMNQVDELGKDKSYGNVPIIILDKKLTDEENELLEEVQDCVAANQISLPSPDKMTKSPSVKLPAVNLLPSGVSKYQVYPHARPQEKAAALVVSATVAGPEQEQEQQ